MRQWAYRRNHALQGKALAATISRVGRRDLAIGLLLGRYLSGAYTMLKGSDLVVLVQRTRVTNVEDHVGTLYEMRSDELSGRIGAVMGGYLGALASRMVAYLTEEVGPSESTILAIGGLVVVTAGIASTISLTRQIAELRTQSAWAKDLTIQLLRVFPRPSP